MQIIWGVINERTREFIDVSDTVQGAKIIATRDGYKEVGYRNVNHYYVTITSIKKGGRWIDIEAVKHSV